jgi:hypothetical protein
MRSQLIHADRILDCIQMQTIFLFEDQARQ